MVKANVALVINTPKSISVMRVIRFILRISRVVRVVSICFVLAGDWWLVCARVQIYLKYSMPLRKIFKPSPSFGKLRFLPDVKFCSRIVFSFFSSQPSSLVQELNLSGCGIKAKILPEGSQTPVMSSMAPFGFAGNLLLAGEPSSFTNLKTIWSLLFIFFSVSGST